MREQGGPEVRSLEFSYFVQATEDEEKVTRGVRTLVGEESEAQREELEGHFGNKIVWVRFHLVGGGAVGAFRKMVSLMGKSARQSVLTEAGSSIDEHGALFVRLSKQLITRGTVETTASDPVRVKVKPRHPRGDMVAFYARAFQEAER